jgi:hypothetical protein
MKSNQEFARQHLGKFAVQHAGLIVRKVFDSAKEAEEWAEWNYRDKANWNVCELKNGKSIAVTSGE